MKATYILRAITYIAIAAVLSFIFAYFLLGLNTHYFRLLFVVEIAPLVMIIAIIHAKINGEI